VPERTKIRPESPPLALVLLHEQLSFTRQ
jgi:hypothetical protein